MIKLIQFASQKFCISFKPGECRLSNANEFSVLLVQNLNINRKWLMHVAQVDAFLKAACTGLYIQ
jgi:hypothetical protein